MGSTEPSDVLITAYFYRHIAVGRREPVVEPAWLTCIWSMTQAGYDVVVTYVHWAGYRRPTLNVLALVLSFTRPNSLPINVCITLLFSIWSTSSLSGVVIAILFSNHGESLHGKIFFSTCIVIIAWLAVMKKLNAIEDKYYLFSGKHTIIRKFVRHIN